jgi:hypothetical protein
MQTAPLPALLPNDEPIYAHSNCPALHRKTET